MYDTTSHLLCQVGLVHHEHFKRVLFLGRVGSILSCLSLQLSVRVCSNKFRREYHERVARMGGLKNDVSAARTARAKMLGNDAREANGRLRRTSPLLRS